MRATGWKAFWLWAVAGALLSFAVLAIMSIGLYLLPVAIIVTVLIARRASAWPETLGVLEGAAATALWVAFISAGVPLCSKEGQMSASHSETQATCGRAACHNRSVVSRTTADQSNENRAGLCATCRHVRLVTSSSGSTFYLCRLSDVDTRFRRYPTLPVRSCSGYEPLTDPPPAKPDRL